LTWLAAEFDATLQRLANADVQIDSLKQQLDDAMGAEDMLVQLTERNLLLGEASCVVYQPTIFS
jgi:dynactin 1